MNNTTTSAAYVDVCHNLDSPLSKIFQIFGYFIVFTAALSGNLLIVARFYNKKKARTLVDALITNMAVSDVLVAILVVSLVLHNQITETYSWSIPGKAGDIMCKLLMFFGDVVSLVSITSLCIITIERFIMVVIVERKHPFQRQRQVRSKWLNPVLITISWLLPMAFDFHFFFHFGLIYKPEYNATHCGGPFFPSQQSYYIYNVTTCFVIIIVPFFILSALNAAIVVKLRRMFNSLRAAGQEGQNENLKNFKSQREIKNMMIAIVTAFGVCWGPYFMIAILYTFHWNLQVPYTCSFYTISYVAVFMTRAHAAINPWIYLYFRKEKRVRFLTSLIQTFPLRPRGRQRVAPKDAQNVDSL